MKKGVLCILASAFGFALMAFFVRLTDNYGEAISSFQKSFFRNAIAFAIAGGALWRYRLKEEEKGSLGVIMHNGRTIRVLLFRSVAGTLGIFCNFYALSRIPISDAMTLNKTAPFFTVFFSWLFLKERATLRSFLALAVAFSGAILVIRPGFRGTETFPALCGLAGGLSAGIAYTCVRELGRMKIPSALTVFVFSGFSTLASLPLMAIHYTPMTSVQTLILMGAGCGAAIGQFGITLAYRFAPPRDIAIFDYSNIVFTAVLGFVFLSQTPDWCSVLGFLAILSAAFIGTRN